MNLYSFLEIKNTERCVLLFMHTCFFFYKKHDFKKHEAEITGPVDC